MSAMRNQRAPFAAEDAEGLVESQRILERFEHKYIIPERLCGPIRDYISYFCEMDPYSRQEPGHQYVITSLYLDTPDRAFYRAVQDRDLNRFKLRIRTYGENADGPVFLEVKRRAKETIIKTRTRVDAGSWAGLLKDVPALRPGLPSGREARFLDEFLYLASVRQAGPSALVRYHREAYRCSLYDYVRVTFDRRLTVAPADAYDLRSSSRPRRPIDNPASMDAPFSGVVLELKFSGHAPFWMTEMARRFGLERRGFSKYCRGVEQVHWGAYERSSTVDTCDE